MPIDHVKLARELAAARRQASPVELPTIRHPGLTWEDARAVARASDDLRRTDGERAVGWKLGWTSAAMREALGIERPNWGTLWDTQIVEEEIDLDRLIHAKIEPELVFRSAVDLEPGMTAADIEAAGGEWALGLEIVDPRFPSFEFDHLDNTADNSSSALVAIGPFVDPERSPAQVEVSFTNGEEHRDGVGANALEDPYEAVAWLVGSLAADGEQADRVAAGHVVFTGGLTAPFDLARGVTYTLTASGFEPVTATCG